MTKAPCHGCGSTREHPKGALCIECRAKFAQLELLEKQQKWAEGLVPHTFRWGAHNEVPYVMCFEDTGFGDKNLSRRLQQAVYEFCLEATVPDASEQAGTCLVRERGGQYGDTSVSDGRARLVSPRFMELREKMLDLAQQISTESYNGGLRAGTNLLGRLASGEVTIGEFNEKSEGIAVHKARKP